MARKDWLDIKLKTRAKDFDFVRTKIAGWPEEVTKEVYLPAVRAISAEGAAFIRNIVETDKNTKKYEQGGDPGRIDTGTMRNSVRYQVRERANGGFSTFVGWTRGEPGYAIFQEQGTKAGVQAMNAIGQAQELMLSQLRALAKGKFTGSYSADAGTLEE